MEISWTNCLINEEVLYRVREERNILHTIKRRKTNWIGHILHSTCLFKHFIEGKIKGGIEVTGRLGGGCKQLLGDLKEMRRYWKLGGGNTRWHSGKHDLEEAMDLS